MSISKVLKRKLKKTKTSNTAVSEWNKKLQIKISTQKISLTFVVFLMTDLLNN